MPGELEVQTKVPLPAEDVGEDRIGSVKRVFVAMLNEVWLGRQDERGKKITDD
jgi:hypothetical protein